MSDRDIMLKALKNTVIKDLQSQGFTGKYPHFKRKKEDCIELIDFQTNKYGGSFTVEVSAVFPNSSVTNLADLTATVDEDKIEVACTNERYRLKGMFDGWFYYRDVYRMPGGFYHDVPEKEKDTFHPSEDWKLLQAFDELAAEEICEEISLQLEDAFDWLFKLERKNVRYNMRTEARKIKEEKVVNKRIFGFVVAFLFCLPLAFVFFWAEVVYMGIIFFIGALLQIFAIITTPVGYIFSQERVVIKYLFGLEESTTWGRVFSVTRWFEEPFKYFYLDVYKLTYRQEKKRYFFMEGIIVKNKKTTELMKKYCPKKID